MPNMINFLLILLLWQYFPICILSIVKISEKISPVHHNAITQLQTSNLHLLNIITSKYSNLSLLCHQIVRTHFSHDTTQQSRTTFAATVHMLHSNCNFRILNNHTMPQKTMQYWMTFHFWSQSIHRTFLPRLPALRDAKLKCTSLTRLPEPESAMHNLMHVHKRHRSSSLRWMQVNLNKMAS